ncbi:Phosphatidylglycerol/phosphatidylinositol transfer protein [Erysiphe neolycopersici]|uniref:Phosphatidylglycerol/phosphatidylinositol transfer protein n=1 Tax=Erysiphe neolycopersici TaxID=212602 RepID=A0A420HW87_9PEZI|nr:Phosphatidylglycerol/phosphatidylinositol transfer protein [Erysiphe neolycopersici]
MKVHSSILILTTFALHAFSHAITSNIKFSSPQGSQNFISDGLDLSVPGENNFKHCSEDFNDDVLQLDSIDLTPIVPKKGEILLIKARGKLLQQIVKGAYVRVKVSYGLITLYQRDIDLCEEISNLHLTCPLEKGTFTIEKKVELPSSIPPGTFKVIADAYTNDDMKLVCLTTSVNF